MKCWRRQVIIHCFSTAVVIGRSWGSDCRKWEEYFQEGPGQAQQIFTFFQYLLLSAKEKLQAKYASCMMWCSCLYTKSSHHQSRLCGVQCENEWFRCRDVSNNAEIMVSMAIMGSATSYMINFRLSGLQIYCCVNFMISVGISHQLYCQLSQNSSGHLRVNDFVLAMCWWPQEAGPWVRLLLSKTAFLAGQSLLPLC